jgi:hypothetical protein
VALMRPVWEILLNSNTLAVLWVVLTTCRPIVVGRFAWLPFC